MSDSTMIAIKLHITHLSLPRWSSPLHRCLEGFTITVHSAVLLRDFEWKRVNLLGGNNEGKCTAYKNGNNGNNVT